MKRIIFVLSFLLGNAAYAANDLDGLENLGAGEFRLLSEDAGAALSYKALIPAEPMGILGFDVGVEVTATKFANSTVMDKAMGGAPTYLPVAKVHVHKGLPFGFDVGAFLGKVAGNDVGLFGAELRYALIKGGTLTPAVAIRLTMSKMSDLEDMDLDTQGVELTVSKGFAVLTPYAGIGKVNVETTAKGTAGAIIAGLDGTASQDFDLDKIFAGFNVNLIAMNLAFEIDKTGDANTLGAKFGWRF
jgi:hypothetical protein